MNDPERKKTGNQKEIWHNKKESLKPNRKGKYMKSQRTSITYQKTRYQKNLEVQLTWIIATESNKMDLGPSTANKYYVTAGHHEQKNAKTTGQIKFSAVLIKQRTKLVLRHSLCKNEFNVLVQVLLLRSFIYSISCLVK